MVWKMLWRRESQGEAAHGDCKISVIVPVLNEEKAVEASIRSARRTSKANAKVEVIVVDGGSVDGTVKKARSLGAKVVHSGRGRGVQQDKGSKAATGDLMLFLHADSELPRGYDSILCNALRSAEKLRDEKHIWGAFGELGIKLKGPLVRVIEFGVKARTRFLRMPYGDQCIFFHRRAYEESGGYKHIPFMEDYDLVHRQRRQGIKPLVLGGKVTTSGRRWRDNGVIRVFLLNQIIILSWHLGISPQKLMNLYYNKKLNKSE